MAIPTQSDIFDYIEGFYNRIQRHKHLDQLSLGAGIDNLFCYFVWI